MTQKELNRKEIIQKLIDGLLTNDQAAQILGLSRRQVLRLKAGYRENGVEYLIHGNRYRRPAHTITNEMREKVTGIVCERYSGYSYRAIRDMLERREGIKLSVSSVGRILRSSGIRNGKCGKPAMNDTAFSSRSILYLGKKIQCWAGRKTGPVCLTVAFDISSGRMLSMSASRKEEEYNYLEAARKAVIAQGVPEAAYSEDRNIFFSSESLTIEDELEGRNYHPTSLGEALEKLGIRLLNGSSADLARRAGRIWADISEFLAAELSSGNFLQIGELNRNTEAYMSKYNKRYSADTPGIKGYGRMSAAVDPEVLFSHREKIEVCDNSMVYHNGKIYKITAPDGRNACIRSGNRVTLHMLRNRNKEIIMYKGAMFILEEMSPLLRRTV